jgi:hypothetical protein
MIAKIYISQIVVSSDSFELIFFCRTLITKEAAKE